MVQNHLVSYVFCYLNLNQFFFFWSLECWKFIGGCLPGQEGSSNCIGSLSCHLQLYLLPRYRLSFKFPPKKIHQSAQREKFPSRTLKTSQELRLLCRAVKSKSQNGGESRSYAQYICSFCTLFGRLYLVLPLSIWYCKSNFAQSQELLSYIIWKNFSKRGPSCVPMEIFGSL